MAMSATHEFKWLAPILGISVIVVGVLVAFGLWTGVEMEKKRPKQFQEWRFGRVVLHAEGGREWIQNGNDYPIFVQMVTVIRPKDGHDNVLVWDIPIAPFEKASCIIKPETVYLLYRGEPKGRACFGMIIPQPREK